MTDGGVRTRRVQDGRRGGDVAHALANHAERVRSLVLSIHIGAGRCSATLVEPGGAVCSDNPASTDETSLPSLLEDVLRDRPRRGLVVRGLAFALPTGERWVEVAGSAAQRTGLPFAIHSAAAAALEGEMMARSAAGERAPALLLDGDDIQAAMQLRGKPFSGTRGGAGAIAHLGLDRTGAVACACGRTGCLGALLQAGAAAPEPPLPQGLLPAPSRPLGWLATAGIALVNVLNPALVFVQGACFGTPSSLAWFEQVVRAGCLAETGAGLRDVARANPRSILAGAASLAATRLS